MRGVTKTRVNETPRVLMRWKTIALEGRKIVIEYINKLVRNKYNSCVKSAPKNL